MKRSLLALLLAALLLAGCTGQAVSNEAEIPAPSEEESAPEAEWTVDQLRDALRPWLEQDLSLSYFTSFFPKRGYGIVETIEQTGAADESFTFDYQVHYWSHVSGLDHEESARYHYAREDGALVCNVLFDEEDFQHFVLTEAEETELEAARQQLIGVDALLPAYAEDLRQSDAEDEADQIRFYYTLPLEKILRGDDKLSQMLNVILIFAGKDAYPDTGLRVGAELIAERETLRPVSVRYDFSELEPTLAALPDSREGEVTGPRMEMEFRFDYRLAETIPLPEYLLQGEDTAVTAEDPAALPQSGTM